MSYACKPKDSYHNQKHAKSNMYIETKDGNMNPENFNMKMGRYDMASEIAVILRKGLDGKGQTDSVSWLEFETY